MFKIFLKQSLLLSLLQFSNVVIPFVSVPYIARILSTSDYGLINFAQAYSVYFSLLINYAFDLSAVRHIAVHSENKAKLSSIVSVVLTSKFFLFLISTCLFIGVTFSVEKLREDLPYHIAAYAINIGFVFFPTWLYQGMGKMLTMSITTVLVRIFSLIAIFTLVNQSSGALTLLIIYSAANIIIAFILLFHALLKFSISYSFPNLSEILEALKDGFPLFISTITINLYTASNIFILGILANTYYVGLFTSSLKMVQTIQFLIMTPINQVLFPLISKSFHESHEKGIEMINKALVIVVPILFLAGLMLFVFAELAINIVFGNQFLPAVSGLRIMVFTPMIIGISNLLGIHGMLNLKMDKQFLFVTIIGAAFCVLLNLVLIPQVKEIGPALAWFFTEIIITLSIIILFYKRDIAIFRFDEMKLFASDLVRKVRTHV